MAQGTGPNDNATLMTTAEAAAYLRFQMASAIRSAWRATSIGGGGRKGSSTIGSWDTHVAAPVPSEGSASLVQAAQKLVVRVGVASLARLDLRAFHRVGGIDDVAIASSIKSTKRTVSPTRL